MSTEAYNRSIAREAKVWTPFAYSFPFDTAQTTERTTIFGLYSSAYLNRNKYLLEFETEDLANMLADYNLKIADLTQQETIILNDIVSRRYLASIDSIINDQKLATKEAKIEADEALWDAKTDALATDAAALETMAVKVATETEKTAARISEIQSYIEMESVHLDMADIEIAEKEIQSAKVDIQKLDTQNQVLKIQLETVRAAQELVDVAMKISRTKVDIAEVEKASNKIDLLASELTIEQARTDIAEAEIPVAQSKALLAVSKTDEIQAEVDYLATLGTQAGTAYQNKINLMNTRNAGNTDIITMRRQAVNLDNSNKLSLSGLDKTFTNNASILQVQLDAAKITTMGGHAWNVSQMASNEVANEKIKAAAIIGTTLTHTIMKRHE
jgi:hypothetical protein